MGWAGKTFRSSEDVEPVLVYDADGKRKLHTDWGHARVGGSLFFFSVTSTSPAGSTREVEDGFILLLYIVGKQS